jgi:hypothetical protein
LEIAMKISVAIIVLALLPFDAGVARQDSLQETLLSQERRIIEAIKQKDRESLEAMLAHEVFAVTADGGRQSGAQMLESLNEVTIAEYRVSEVKSVEVSKDVGILTYKFTSRGSRGGEKVPATTVFATSTWAHRDGRWTCVFYQETPVIKP